MESLIIHRLYHEAGELLVTVWIDAPFTSKPIYELGIGQQQLVEIAKALGRSLQAPIEQRRSLQAPIEQRRSLHTEGHSLHTDTVAVW